MLVRAQIQSQTRRNFGLEAAGDDRFAVLACVADEWQQVVDQGLGGYDLTVVTKALEQQGQQP